MTQPYAPTREQIEALRAAYGGTARRGGWGTGETTPAAPDSEWASLHGDMVNAEPKPEPYTVEQIQRLRDAYGGLASPSPYQRTMPVTPVPGVAAVRAEAASEVERAAEEIDAEDEKPLRERRPLGELVRPTKPLVQTRMEPLGGEYRAGSRVLHRLDREIRPIVGDDRETRGGQLYRGTGERVGMTSAQLEAAKERRTLPRTPQERAFREIDEAAGETSARWDILRDELRGLESDEAAQKAHSEENDRAWGEAAMRLRRAAGLPTAAYGEARPVAPVAEVAAPSAVFGADVGRGAVDAEQQRKALAVANLEMNPIGALLGVTKPPADLTPTPEESARSAALAAANAPNPGPPAPVASTPKPLVSVAPPAVSQAPAPTMSVEPPGKPVGTREGRPAPAARGARGGTDLDEYASKNAEERAIIDAQIAAERAKRGGVSPATAEREQRTGIHRERAQGPEPALVAEEEALLTGPGSMVDTSPKAAPAATSAPADVLRVLQPPKDATTPAKRAAWAQEIARDLGAKGISLATAAQTMDRRRPDYPPGLLRDMRRLGSIAEKTPEQKQEMDDLAAEMEDFNAAHVADIDAAAASSDAKNAKTRAGFDAREALRMDAAQAAKETLEQDLGGPQGQVGIEKAKLRTDARGAEATADAERELARLARDSAEKQGAALAESEEAKSGFRGVLQKIALVIGAAGTGFVEGPSKALDFIERQTSAGARKLSDKLAVQKGIELAQYKAVEHDLNAKLAMGLGEKQMLAVQGLLGKVRLEINRKQQELSAATRGTEKTASAVIPARAASSGGGRSLERLRKLTGEQRGLLKEEAELTAKGHEGPKKAERPETFTYNGVTYDQTAATSTAEGHEARKIARTMEEIDKLLTTAEDLVQRYGERGYNPSRLKNTILRLGAKVSTKEGQGVVTNPEVQQNLDAFGSWTDPKAVIADTRKMINDDRKALFSQLGADNPRRAVR